MGAHVCAALAVIADWVLADKTLSSRPDRHVKFPQLSTVKLLQAG